MGEKILGKVLRYKNKYSNQIQPNKIKSVKNKTGYVTLHTVTFYKIETI